MNILGVSCYYHDSSACIISNNKVFAAQEERFNRQKNTAVFPEKSINFCLDEAKISAHELDYVIFYEKPFLKFLRVLENSIKSFPFSLSYFMNNIPRYLGERLVFEKVFKEKFEFNKDILYSRHHISHGASAFLVSPFEKSLIMTCDGIGEFSSMCEGYGEGNNINIEETSINPNSLGLLYSAVTTYLGFRANGGEGKIMALADLGNPEYYEEFKEIINLNKDNSFNIDESFFDFRSGGRMFTKKFEKRFGKKIIDIKDLKQKDFDVASSLQKLVESIILKKIEALYEKHKIKNLSVAGGVFLNCVMNSKIIENTPIENMFVQPAAGDAGGALGAAFYLYNTILNNKRDFIMKRADLGPCFSKTNIKMFLEKNKIEYKELSKEVLIDEISDHIVNGDVVGWFQNRMEFGPRALGNRSILANPCIKDMKDQLNNKVKHREWFRPYGISILEEKLSNVLDTDNKNNFMLFTAQVKDEYKDKIPSGKHLDNSSRYQTVSREDGIYYDLIDSFYKKTGIPLIINTSFNDNKEPVVCSPEDAYNCFAKTNMDVLVLNDLVIKKP